MGRQFKVPGVSELQPRVVEEGSKECGGVGTLRHYGARRYWQGGTGNMYDQYKMN